MTQEKKRVLILGIGGAGVKTIRALERKAKAEWMTTAVIDSDYSTLQDHPADTVIVQLPADRVSCHEKQGMGCGGDMERGVRVVTRERASIIPLFQECDLIIVTGGLGGGTATGGLPLLAKWIRSQGTPAVFLLHTPFSFEPFVRKKNSDDCIEQLADTTDILLTVSNDLLISRLPPDTPAEQAFEYAADEMASTIAGIASVMRCRDLVGSDFAVFMNALRKHRCTCGIGIGRADADDGSNRTIVSVEKMLSSPFLGGSDFLKKSNAAILLLTGGENLSISDMKRSMEIISDLCPSTTEVLSGINIVPDIPDYFQLTAIAIHYDDVPVQAPAGDLFGKESEVLPNNTQPSQMELGLTSFSRGIFENLPITRYNNTDLDVPTFQRKNITVNKGC